MLRRLFLILLFLAPLLWVFLPVPIADGSQLSMVRVLLCITTFLVLLSWSIVSYFCRRYAHPQVSRFLVLGGTAAAVGLLVHAGFFWPVSPYVTAGLVWLVVLILGALSGRSERMAGSGLLSLVLVLALLVALEFFLRSIPERYYAAELKSIPPLVPAERSYEVFKKHGFRGRWPCKGCDDTIRIFTMGGSSTFGVPMYRSDRTYPAYLQRFLDERRPGERYEVLNAGVAGFGIIQILDNIEESVLPHEPDVVTIAAWFNDSSYIPGWYGYRDKSDKEAFVYHAVLKKIQAIPGYTTIHNSKLYALYRFGLLQGVAGYHQLVGGQPGKIQRIRRANRGEFAWGLREIMKLAEEHDFMPVLMYEPLNRTKGREASLERIGYYNIIKKIAEERDLIVVSALDELAARRDQWLFYDFIHPNWRGHRIIAEELFSGLTSVERQTERSKAFLSARGVDFSLPKAKRRHFLQYPAKELSGRTLEIKARAPFANDREVKLELHDSSGDTLVSLTGLGSSMALFKIEPITIKDALPLVDLELTAAPVLADLDPEREIGSTGVYSTVFIDAISGGKECGWTGSIMLDGRRYDRGSRGYNLVFFDPDSGQVLDRRSFDAFRSGSEASALLEYLVDPEIPVKGDQVLALALVVHTDGFHNVDRERLSSALKRYGGSGAVPVAFESFGLIGVRGAPAGSALEQQGCELIKLQVGSQALVDSQLLEVESVRIRS